MRRLRPVDYFQILTTIGYVLLGAVIAVRAGMARVWFGCFFGAVMFSFGVYRARAIVRALRGIGQ